jgi:hypothetical protein
VALFVFGGMIVPPQLGCAPTIAKRAVGGFPMNWFEQLTGLDPDAGSGTFEAMLAALVGVIIIAAAWYVLSRRKTRTAR